MADKEDDSTAREWLQEHAPQLPPEELEPDRGKAAVGRSPDGIPFARRNRGDVVSWSGGSYDEETGRADLDPATTPSANRSDLAAWASLAHDLVERLVPLLSSVDAAAAAVADGKQDAEHYVVARVPGLDALREAYRQIAGFPTWDSILRSNLEDEALRKKEEKARDAGVVATRLDVSRKKKEPEHVLASLRRAALLPLSSRGRITPPPKLIDGVPPLPVPDALTVEMIKVLFGMVHVDPRGRGAKGRLSVDAAIELARDWAGNPGRFEEWRRDRLKDTGSG